VNVSSRQLDEEAIFHVAREISKPEARAAYLDQVCAGDQALRERVEALLAVHEKEQEFLKSSPEVEATGEYRLLTERPGDQIGRYKLLQQIGEGGFGVVYMAEQARPVRRKVALKVIKPGMDTKAVVARFEAERQALAMMDHENIARVLDGGATDSGRPYFVMELVKGVPITEYCDQNHLPTDERLKLFISVCQAVQHAHQKGIIHRDLKPSNILVTLHDGQPVVKVIDFGIAKAINQRLTERTLFTAYGQMVGTPQYMSPEQAEMTGLDIDTRSDIYSLGVLLYELLTGTTPLEADQLRQAGYAEMQRLIKEQEPPKPSTRLSSSGDKLTIIAKHRSMSPEQLQRALRGELDWIVMKALEKERGRRYETPSSFAADVERFLDDQPVEACPPSSSYRFRKFVRRNRSLVAAVSAITAALLLGLMGTTGGLLWALSEQRIALEKAAELDSALSRQRQELQINAMDAILAGKFGEARQLIEDADTAGSSPETLDWLSALAHLYAGEYTECIEALKDKQDLSIAAHATLATAYVQDGRLNEYIEAVTDLVDRDVNRDATYADHLLLGESLTFIDADRAATLLADAIELRDSPYARSAYAHLLAIKAMLTSDLDLARASAEQIEAAEVFWPKLVRVREVSVFSHDVARRLSSGAESEEFERRALLAAAEFEDFSPTGQLNRFLLFNGIGKEDLALEALRKGRDGQAACRLAPFLLSTSPDDALQLYRDEQLPDGAYTSGGEAFLLALSPGTQQQAIDVCDTITREFTDFDFRVDMLCVCLLAGDTGVQQKARDLLPSSRGRFWTCDLVLEYLTSAGTEEDERNLLEKAKRNPFGPHIAEYAIGVRALSEGRRDDAKDFLRRSAASLNFHSAYGLYAATILKRMNEEEGWPHWLPSEQDQ